MSCRVDDSPLSHPVIPFDIHQWLTGHDESVEVNQRALIDKVLARYSGEFTGKRLYTFLVFYGNAPQRMDYLSIP